MRPMHIEHAIETFSHLTIANNKQAQIFAIIFNSDYMKYKKKHTS